jgi:hypothetical protein
MKVLFHEFIAQGLAPKNVSASTSNLVEAIADAQTLAYARRKQAGMASRN